MRVFCDYGIDRQQILAGVVECIHVDSMDVLRQTATPIAGTSPLLTTCRTEGIKFQMKLYSLRLPLCRQVVKNFDVPAIGVHYDAKQNFLSIDFVITEYAHLAT